MQQQLNMSFNPVETKTRQSEILLIETEKETTFLSQTEIIPELRLLTILCIYIVITNKPTRKKR